ncbi:PLP-dependent aminotransferase family protein [Phototrophicus methaneseepsis]|uniref:PLP-dependent aminotransferase family protein n=1 Tax=Phototrophicus methaneseepsis TaxID=2710758 RepID=A0A7S8E795_9CHLR|nr:PLP-dependent aminotransferase family protein [Phototrophicus methaneseepsis]QPC81656.1 PLP-dependent aminotransferase family protein [Phototrophicus methaneseepsis]
MTLQFTRGVPALDMMPAELLAQSSHAAMQQYAAMALPYGATMGFLPLREWLAQHHDCRVEQVIVGNGSINLIAHWAHSFLSPGDTVIVESPTYDRALTLFQEAGAQIIALPLLDDGIDPAVLEAQIISHKPRLIYLIADFNNPSGVTTSAAKREAIATIAQRHDVLIIEDGAYHQLRYLGEPIPQLRHYAPDNVLSTGSFSKLLAPGLRTGWMILPPQLVDGFVAHLQNMYITPNQYAQATVMAAVTTDAYVQQLARLHDTYRQRLQVAHQALEQYLKPLGTHWAEPEGGFFFGVTVPPTKQPIWDISPAYGLALVNGDGFFHDRTNTNFVRVPFCSLNEADLEEGIERLGQVVRENLA